MYNRFNKIHLIGVGGIGMSGIAELLRRNGYTVTGSDVKSNETIRQLEANGVRVFIGHAEENVAQAELIVFSSAISNENPEMIAAEKNQIPAIPRAEMLAELMRLKYGIAVAGAHGKTTTTSMISLILVQAELDPTIVVGGRMDNFGGTNARMGMGKFMVVEADESDGSFNKLTPAIAVVTNVDREHMDHYQTMGKLKNAFSSFLNKVPFYGLCVVCGDDPYLKTILPKVSRRKKTYGFNPGNQYHLESYEPSGTGSKVALNISGEKVTLQLRVPGKHNALNAVAALAVADELGVDRAVALKALQEFNGVQRRFQKRGEKAGVCFIDDYAHHPSEIRAVLSAAREQYPNSKVRVVFQPHRYSRTEDLLDQFSTSFKACDSVAVTDVYAAGESPIAGIDGSTVADSISREGHVSAQHLSSPKQAIEFFLSESVPGDIIMTLGAGDLPGVYKDLF